MGKYPSEISANPTPQFILCKKLDVQPETSFLAAPDAPAAPFLPNPLGAAERGALSVVQGSSVGPRVPLPADPVLADLISTFDAEVVEDSGPPSLSAPRARQAGGTPALNLYLGHLSTEGPLPLERLEHPCVYLRITRYSNGHAEALAMPLNTEQVEHLTSRRRRPCGERVARSRMEMSLDNLEHSCRRSARLVRESCIQLGADHLFTLTYRENMADLVRGWRDFKAWCRLMRKRYGARFQYVVVPEFQKRGAVHFHLSMRGFWEVRVMRRFWLQVIGDGAVNIADRPSYKGPRQWSSVALAGYMSKYITKAVKDLGDVGRKRFERSRGITPPLVTRHYLALGDDWLIRAERFFKTVTGRSVERSKEFDLGLWRGSALRSWG